VTANVDTVTGTTTACPALSLTLIWQVPAPVGVIVNDAVPTVAFAWTVAIVPVNGAHESVSANAPVYPVSVTVSVAGTFDANASVVAEACGVTGTGVAVGRGDGVAVGCVLGAAVTTGGGAALPPPPPPQAVIDTAHASAAKRMRRFT
jgi:hypothetical protein